MDLKFKILKKENTNMTTFIKQLCTLNCRIRIDTIQETITIFEINDEIIEDIIDNINSMFNIIYLDIIPSIKVTETAINTTPCEIKFPNYEVEEFVRTTKFGKPAPRKLTTAEYLLNLVKSDLASLDKSKPLEEQIDLFLESINFPTDEKIVKLFFISACKVTNWTRRPICLEIKKLSPNEDLGLAWNTMTKAFQKWINKYPEALENYPKINFLELLKVFAKRVSTEIPQKISAEEYISSLIVDALDSLNKNLSLEKQVEEFLRNINFEANNKIVNQSFMVACTLDKQTYHDIFDKLLVIYPNLNKAIVKTTMKKNFNKWLDNYPEVTERYGHVSFVVLLKIFAKRIQQIYNS